MNPLFLALAVLAGAVVPLQAGINARCAAALGSPVYATVVNFVGGACLASVVALVLRPEPGLPTHARLTATPWWAFIGGICGCMLVFCAAFTVKHLGYLGLVAGLILGQMICSLILDQTGFLRDQPHPITFARAGGVALLLAGFWLVNLK